MNREKAADRVIGLLYIMFAFLYIFAMAIRTHGYSQTAIQIILTQDRSLVLILFGVLLGIIVGFGAGKLWHHQKDKRYPYDRWTYVLMFCVGALSIAASYSSIRHQALNNPLGLRWYAMLVGFVAAYFTLIGLIILLKKRW